MQVRVGGRGGEKRPPLGAGGCGMFCCVLGTLFPFSKHKVFCRCRSPYVPDDAVTLEASRRAVLLTNIVFIKTHNLKLKLKQPRSLVAGVIQ
jgi:hypothetical protein